MQVVSTSQFVDHWPILDEPVLPQANVPESRLGTEIRRLRHVAGYSQDTLARLVGVERAEIGVLENGDHTVNVQTLRLIAAALNTKASAILGNAGF